jgi:hypothetical protein
MISFYDVVRIPVEDVASTGGVLVDDAGVDRGSVGGDLHRSGAASQRTETLARQRHRGGSRPEHR